MTAVHLGLFFLGWLIGKRDFYLQELKTKGKSFGKRTGRGVVFFWGDWSFTKLGGVSFAFLQGLHPEHPQIAARQSLFFVSRHGVLIQDIDTQQVAFRKLWSVSCDADLVSLCVYAW